MEPETLTLYFLRDDGVRESVKLSHYTLARARSLAESILRKSNGLYTQVEICTESGQVARVQNQHVTVEVLRKA